MPLINSIEVANFMNRERRNPWEPTWPHCVFPLLGLNSIINVPNGRGKTTIVKLVLFLLAGQKREISKINKYHFAPRSSGYTHVRVQMIMDTEEGAGMDLFSGTPLGKQMVFGIYGNGGENGEYHMYSYPGSLEDCPVHRKDTGFANRINLIPDKEFAAKLGDVPYRFPASARENSAESWRENAEKWFDLPSIEQQIVYQNKAGGEGKSSYFDVPGKESEFAANVFYERLAPELLHDVMGGHGEEDEKNIEDTIHEKTRQVITARRNNVNTAKSLEQTERVLRELSLVCNMAEEMTQAGGNLKACQADIAVELGVLKDAIIDRPFPGLPPQPPAELVDVAQYMVLSNGMPYLSDRGMAYFSGEEPKRINERSDRKGIAAAVEIQNSQLIEITCDQIGGDRNEKGRATRYYELDAATDIVSNTEKFLPEFDRDSSIAKLQRVFEWAGEHADTNPARKEKKEHDKAYNQKKAELYAVNEEITELSKEKLNLYKERTNLDKQGAEHQRMQESGLFTPEELADSGETGRLAKAEEDTARKDLDSHKQMAAKQATTFGHWKQFVEQHGTDASPVTVLEAIRKEEADAKTALEQVKAARYEITSAGKSLQAATSDTRGKRDELKSRIIKAERALEKAAAYDSIFNGEAPEGLESKVRAELAWAKDEHSRLEMELSALKDKLADIELFRSRFGAGRDPAQWIKERSALHEKIRKANEDATKGYRKRLTDLEALEKFSVAPGQFAHDVQANVGSEFVPLHAAIETMHLDAERKANLLTLFSALLFAPVLQSAADAEKAALNLADKTLEFPVFVAADLEHFCRAGDLNVRGDFVRSLFIGVKTQNVECLLDPQSLESRKATLRGLIARSELRLCRYKKALSRTSHESETSKLAERARHAIDSKAEDTALGVNALLDPLKNSLPRLESRAAEKAIESIRAMLDYNNALKGQTIEELKTSLAAAEDRLTKAESAELSNAEALETNNDAYDSANTAVRNTGIRLSQMEPVLKSVAAFIANSEFGPAFMEKAPATEKTLAQKLETAVKRSSFRFEDVQRFVESGATRLQEIVVRLAGIESRTPSLDEQKVILSPQVTSMQEINQMLAGNISKIDGVVRTIIKLYRRHRSLVDGLPAVDLSRHGLYREGSYLRNCTSVQECIKRIIGLEDDIEAVKDSIDDLSGKLKNAGDRYRRLVSQYNDQIDRTVNNEDLKLDAPVILLLQQAKDDPTSVKGVLVSANANYNKDLEANKVARQQLEIEWKSISSWLSEFTRRLPSNLELMKARFAPKKDQDNKFISAGFMITAQAISHDDIEDVLRDIVRDIEDYEESSYLKNHIEVKRDTQDSFRNQIRNKFYRRVIMNPSIKVFIPSISRVTPLVLNKDLASSGQSVAISLLWIVKMSDFVSERERARKTISMSSLAKRKMLSIKSHFIFIDGAFSHLSDRALIDDVLGEIANTRGKFQLIVTGHDREFKPNWKLFPTMLNGREVGDQYMFVEQGAPVEPGKVGSNYGAMSMIRTHVVNTGVSDGTTAN